LLCEKLREGLIPVDHLELERVFFIDQDFNFHVASLVLSIQTGKDYLSAGASAGIRDPVPVLPLGRPGRSACRRPPPCRSGPDPRGSRGVPSVPRTGGPGLAREEACASPSSRNCRI